MRKLFIVLLVLLLTGCAKEGTYQPVTNTRDNFNVVLLFECEGVKVYRFFDAGRYRYFTIGNGNYQPQLQSESNGKSTRYWYDGAY